MIRTCATKGCPHRVRAGDAKTSRPGSTADGRYCGVCRRRQKALQKAPSVARPCYCLDRLASMCPTHGRIG